VSVGDNSTVRLDPDNEPHQDALLLIAPTREGRGITKKCGNRQHAVYRRGWLNPPGRDPAQERRHRHGAEDHIASFGVKNDLRALGSICPEASPVAYPSAVGGGDGSVVGTPKIGPSGPCGRPEGMRNGYGKPQRLSLRIGTMTMRRPRVRGRSDRVVSRVLPSFQRRTRQVGEWLPQHSWHGLALGDFELALRGSLGEGAPPPSPRPSQVRKTLPGARPGGMRWHRQAKSCAPPVGSP
jgi:hypothetical protein